MAKQNKDGQLTAGQKAAHILAHAVLGAAVAAAGNNSAIAGTISAGVGTDNLGNPIMQRANADGVLQNSYYTIQDGKQVVVPNPNATPPAASTSNLHRPYVRTGTQNTVYGDYVQLPNGNYVLKNNTNIVVQGPVHVGHRYGWENRRLIKAADELGMTQQQLNDYVNDPRRTRKLFELQNGPENMGHRLEKPGIDDLDDIKRDMENFLRGK